MHHAMPRESMLFRSRPNEMFENLCRLGNIFPKRDIETGVKEAWLLKDLRKTCATYFDQYV